jgi:hypothetical protein
MKTVKQIMKWVRDAKGVATSLIEATATVAVGAVLAGVAVGGAIDAINDSKIQAAIGDVSSIGQGVITFYKDNAFFPLYIEGDKTGATDNFFHFLVSENGSYPAQVTGADWTVGSGANTWDASSLGIFGHEPNFSENGHGTIEGQLIRNVLNNPTAATPERYPLRGEYAGDPQRGWAGPYVAVLPKTDPWGNKYMIKVRALNAEYLLSLEGSGPGSLAKIAVIVLSAGPNRTIETSPNQQFDNFAALGDDIVFRVK